MKHVLYPQPGYPFALSLDSSIEYSLSDRGFPVQTTATNVGRDPCPYGSGAHPYLTLGTTTVDGLILRVPGRRRAVSASDSLGMSIDGALPLPCVGSRKPSI
jgi:galactose mutarotase-like enzyme